MGVLLNSADIVNWGGGLNFPDYSLATNITSPFTCPSDCFVKFSFESSTRISLKVNGLLIDDSGTYASDVGMFVLPFKKGTLLEFNNTEKTAARYFPIIQTYTEPRDCTDYVIDYQKPTAENSYTWYRLYKSGWVEQGGYIVANTSHRLSIAITLPIKMANENYQVSKTPAYGAENQNYGAVAWYANNTSAKRNTSTTAYFSVASSVFQIGAWWEVKGFADTSSISA